MDFTDGPQVKPSMVIRGLTCTQMESITWCHRSLLCSLFSTLFGKQNDRNNVKKKRVGAG